MKDSITLIFAIFSISLLMAFTEYKRQPKTRVVTTIPSVPIVKTKLEIKTKEIKFKGHTAFLNALGHQESGNRYDVVNRFGYMGQISIWQINIKNFKN